MISKHYKGMSLFSLLVCLMIFSGIMLSIQQWMSAQQKSAVYLYQILQALQLAENQQQRQFLDITECPSVQKLNQIDFYLHCQADKITVKFPLGQISVP